jgi:cytochrome c peroxidase
MRNSINRQACIAAMAAVFFLANACQKATPQYETDNLKLPTTTDSYKASTSFTGAVAANPLTDDGATLGRVLFYDKKLSLTNTISCGSCHHQSRGFADAGATSEGFKGERTKRNAMALANEGLEGSYFWDTRTKTLEDLVLQPVGNHIEMGLDNTDNLVKKLQRTTYYPELFKKAFGTTDITQDRVSKAVAQFMRSMVSNQSKFDQGQAANFSNFTAEEARGRTLFFNQLHCTGCHTGNNFNGKGNAQNIGLDKDYQDNGLGSLTGSATQNGVFKVPTLRNVELTGPYMHDGRFKTLDEVVEHYDAGVQQHPNLSFFLNGFLWSGNGGSSTAVITGCWSCGVGQATGGTFKPLQMTDTDKKSLVAFLKTLTDKSFVTASKFSNPFE